MEHWWDKTKNRNQYTRGITSKRVTSGRAHLHDLAPMQHSCEEVSQQWRAVGDSVTALSDPGIEPRTPRADSDVIILSANRDETKFGKSLPFSFCFLDLFLTGSTPF